MALSAHQFLQQALNNRMEQGSLRYLRPDSDLIDFCSNDYLGFARSAELKDLVKQELSQHHSAHNGSTGSRLLAGNTNYAEELEHYIANYHGHEAGLLFNSGYDANLGLFSSLPQRGDTVIHDELIHASIIDGIRLSHANRYSFKHNDLENLEQKLKQAKGNIYIAVESVYSMDGDMAPLEAIADLAYAYHANLIVDEAHGIGVFGKGLVNQLNIEGRLFAHIITFGKAMGCHGAIVLGSDVLRQYLVNFARSFIYTTAAPLHQLATVKMAYQLLEQSEASKKTLHHKISLYKQWLQQAATITSPSAIQTVVLGSNQKAKAAAKALQDFGFDVRAILSPTVPAGTERLRICVHAYNSDDEIIALTHHINTLIHESK